MEIHRFEASFDPLYTMNVSMDCFKWGSIRNLEFTIQGAWVHRKSPIKTLLNKSYRLPSWTWNIQNFISANRMWSCKLGFGNGSVLIFMDGQKYRHRPQRLLGTQLCCIWLKNSAPWSWRLFCPQKFHVEGAPYLWTHIRGDSMKHIVPVKKLQHQLQSWEQFKKC